MKNSLLLLTLLAGATSLAQAQTAIPAGTVSLGGGIGYNRSTTEVKTSSGGNETTYNTFRITPTVGYFVADNLAIGLNAGYSIGKYAEGTDRKETTFRVGPYVQYYKMLSDQFGFLGTFGAGYQHNEQPYFDPNVGPYALSTKGFYAGITPGIVFFPVPKLGISASIGGLTYDRVSLENDASTLERTVSDFGANFGLDQLTFGGTFYFGR